MFRRPSRIAVPLLVFAGLALLAVPASSQNVPVPDLGGREKGQGPSEAALSEWDASLPTSTLALSVTWWFPKNPQTPPPIVRYEAYLNPQ